MVIIEPMRLEDLEEVLLIEDVSFTIPWSRYSFLHELLENERAIYLVARETGQVRGYIGMWIVLNEGHITSLAVHPAYRRRGIGQRLLQSIINEGKKRGLQYLTLEVRLSNTGAQELYKKMGFTSRGIRPRYYQDNHEDAVIMWKGPI